MENGMRSEVRNKIQEAPEKLLPGYNCSACGEKRCDEFSAKLMTGKSSIDKCAFMLQERFSKNRSLLMELLEQRPEDNGENEIIGLIDGYRADFELKPLPGEPSCREVLYPFAKTELKPGDIIRYRPLGCPVIHFAKILQESHGLVTVHIIGPGKRVNDSDFKYEDIGVCMVGGFEGIIDGKHPFVGQTVRFLPQHCMMRKVHSGIVVQLVGDRIILEGIDLKVWAPPI